MYEDFDQSTALAMITIYRRPRDFPDHQFVARVWYVTRHAPDPQPARQLFAAGRTLEEIRRQLPPGLYRIGREPNDDPAIVETWL